MFRICHNSRLIRSALMLMYAGRLKSWMHQLQSQVAIWHWPAHLIPPQPKIQPRISSLIDVILSMQLHMLTNIPPLFCTQMAACSNLFLPWKDWPSLWMQINCTGQLWVTLSFTHPFTLLKNYTLTLTLISKITLGLDFRKRTFLIQDKTWSLRFSFVR